MKREKPKPVHRPRRVLVVDDDENMNALLRDFLERNGYTVATMTSVAGALLWLHSLPADHPPDLVLSDIKMGKRSGLDLARRLKVENPELPVVLFSVLEELQGEALKSGARRFLRKPFTLATLAQVLSEELDSKVTEKNK